jgi:hypothetical protein
MVKGWNGGRMVGAGRLKLETGNLGEGGTEYPISNDQYPISKWGSGGEV